MDSNFRSRRNQILSYLFLGMLLASARVQATGNPYFQVISGAWTSGASWSNGVPNGGSLATIDNAGTAILTTNGGTYNLVLGSNTAANALLITNGGNLQVGYTTSIGFNAASSNNYVLVNGAGSGATWASGQGLALGVSGASNTIIVTNGGIVTNEFTYEGQNSTSSNNSVVVTGSNSLVANLGFFYVGYGGGGNQLVISNGGKVTTGAFTVGGPAGGVVGAGSSGNSAIVTGSNSLWSNSANLTVGSGGSSNTLTISAGGSVVDSNATVGILGTGNSALITGSNSIWRNSGTFTLGGTYSSSSSNLLTISNGGVLIDSNGEIGNGGNFNTVVVTGSNSLWSNTGTLTIGDNGGISNSLIVNSNGALAASSIVLGGSNSSFNTLAISGSGNLTNLTSLTIGGGGYNNTLTVTNALALAPPGSSISVGTGSGTSNSLVVTGPGATVSGGSGLQLTVGNGGNANSLVISNGASVTGTTGYVGFGGYSINPIGSSNTALVTGSNGTSSSWTLSGQLELGYEGFSNSLIISNGATVTANGIMIGQGDANSSANANNNSILVTGSNSVLTASGSSTITIGTNVANTNSLVISNGGKVFSGTGVIGSDASYGNFALVTGPGSLWSNSGSIYVGDKIYSGNGTLTVAANGTVTTTNLYVAYGTGSSGTVNYGTYGGSDTNFTINTPLFTFGNGAGTVNFNQANTMTNSTPFVGSNALAVDVIAQLGSGTTVLTSQGSTNNATLVVDGGQLILNGARFNTTSNSAPLSGNVYVGFQGQGALPNYSNNTPVSLVITNATQLGANEVIVGQGVFNVASDGNSLLLGNGTISSAGGAIGYFGNGNSALITGSNSLWSNSANLPVGNGGSSNTLTISAGGMVVDSNSTVGNAGSGNSALITGSGSLWSNTGAIGVGYAGGSNNSLVISNGATVDSVNVAIGYDGNSNSAIVTGSNSLWSNPGDFKIGYEGLSNSLVISNGATVSNGFLYLGYNSSINANNTVVVTGPGSTLSNNEGIDLGYYDNGDSITVTNGAKLYGAGDVIGLGGNNNTLLVTGSNSLYSNASYLDIGNNGQNNSLIVTNGATVLTGSGNIGYGGGSGNFALVTGSGSLWSNSGSLYVGGSDALGGNGTLTVSANGTVVTTNLYVAFGSNSSGTVNYGAYGGSDTNFNINTPVITFGNGTGTVNFNQANTLTNSAIFTGTNAQTFDIIAQLGSGTTVLTGQGGTNSASLVVNGSQLILNGARFTTTANNASSYSGNVYVGLQGASGTPLEGYSNNSPVSLVITNGAQLGAYTVFVGEGVYSGATSDGNSLLLSNGTISSAYATLGDSGNGNSALITGSNSLWSNTVDFKVGQSSGNSDGLSNSLVISNGATVDSSTLSLGYASFTNAGNTVVVTGPGSTLSNSAEITIGYYDSGNSITVTNGAKLYGSNDTIGNGGNGNSLLVTGSNSLYSNAGSLTIGYYLSSTFTASNNSLVITNGAQALVKGSTYIGYESDTNGNNTVLVTGSGSIFSNTTGFYLGYYENGDSITVTNGAKLYGSGDQIGVYGSNNTLLVTGSNSLYSNATSLYVGYSNAAFNNSLIVTNGAQALVSGTTYLGNNSSNTGDNTILVTGTNSTFSNTGGFVIGNGENGDSITVTNGAKLYGSGDNIGDDSTNNTLLVTGSNSLYSNADSLHVALGGASNSLQVLGGAHALVSGTTYIGYETGTNGNNTVLVSGSGSVFSNTLGFDLGYYENGDSITVTNGAKLYGNDDTIGYGSSTNGGNNNTLLVTGPGSLYSNSEGLTIGNNTNGNGTNNSLVISNGAKAILGADGLSLGNYSGTNGNNTVLVTGTNSTLDSSAGGISIGAGENGDSITVTNGAKLYGNDDTIGYINTVGGNSNTLLVTDTNSLYSNSSDLNIGQGANGNTLIVTNGAHALVAGDTSIGTSGGSSNSITVTGPGSSLIVAGNIMVGTSSGNANYLTLDNGAFVSAATLTVYSNSVLSGNGTITTTADPTINGGTLAPTGTNALVINGNTTFTNNGTFVWNLFNNSTNNPSSGTNFTVPVILNGNLNVTNSTLDVVLNNLVSATNSFWRTPGVTNSWVIIQGTNASIGNGLNFNVNFLGQTTDFALTDFSLVTNRADQLVLNYFYNTNDVDTIVTNNGTTNVAVSPGVNNNVTQNGSGTTSLGGSGAASLAIVVNNGTLNTTNTTGVLSPLVNVTVNGGVFGIQAPGTNVVNNFTVNGGTVLSPSNVIVTVTNPSGMNITGGNLSGGTFQAADYIFSPATTSSVSATLENLNTNSWAVITNNSGGASGTTVFTTNMAYTGDTLITNATLQLGSGSSTGSVLGVITNYGVLDFGYNGNTNTPSNVVLGNGVIGQVGTGTLTIGTNGIGTSFTGSFAVANGTLAIATNSALGNSTNFYLANNGTLQATTGVTNITNANVTNGTGIIDNASGSTLTLNGTLKKSGTTLILTGGNFSVQGQITGSGTPGSFDSDLIISNATATLNAGNNNYVGPTTIEAGSGLSNGIVNALPTNTLLNVGALTDAAVTNTYNLAGYNQTLAGLASPTTASSTNQVTNSGAAAILKINGATNTVYAGTISGNLSMVRQGLGSTLLSGNNSYTGGTTINSGKLITANNNALGTGNVTLAGGTLQLNNILTISSFIWNSSTSTNSQVALPNASGANDYLNVTSTITRGSSISYFNLTGVTLNNTPTELLYFGTNLLTTGEFKVVGLTTHYKLFIENGDSLWINLNGTNNPTNGLTVYPTTTTVGNTATYSSATFLNNGILNITPTGNLTLTTNVAVNNNSTVILNGVLNVSNTLTIDPGSTLTGAGTLNGNLINSGFVGGPGNLTVTRNFIQNPTGTFILNPNGPSTSNKLKAGGSISLAGNLQVKPANGYVIQIGNSYNFLSAPGGISGNFAAIDMPSGYRGRFLKSDNNTLGTLLIAPQSYTQMAANRNQLNVASALNSFISATSGDQLVVSTSLDSLNASQYQEALNGILPNFYQSLATIAFNSANAQNSELLQRLWGLRVAEGGGFSMSGLPDNTAVIEGQGDGESPGKGVLDSKKDILRPGLDNHWGMFLDGNGIFAQANSANMLPGYTAESGGVTTGLTYKWNDNFGTGLYCGYEGTYAKYGTAGSGLGVGSSLIDNAVRFGVFGTYGQKNAKGEAVGFYANALAGGGYNNYQATRVIQYGTYGSPTSINRTASSSPGAGELDTMLAGGYDLKRGHWTYGPTASLQYTYLGVNPVNETGAQSLDFNSQSWNSQSLLSSVGAHAAYTWQANNDIVVVPQISLAWQHEFMQNPYAINGTLGGASPNFSNWSSAPIRDFLYTGVGVTVEFYKRWNASLFYNASVGNTDLTSENIFLSAGVKF